MRVNTFEFSGRMVGILVAMLVLVTTPVAASAQDEVAAAAPQARQVATSILNTRFSLCAQVIAT